MAVRILVAPSGFKESIGTVVVADCIETGLLRAYPQAKIFKAPLVDGGEGFTEGLVNSLNGTMHLHSVTGPVGLQVDAFYGLVEKENKKTAVLEMSSAAGLRLVPADKRDPLKTTTFGVGELILKVLDEGAEQILIGCGDSGTNDGGIGMAQALGMRFYDRNGSSLGYGGGELTSLHFIDYESIDPRIAHVSIDVACNWSNVLCGPNSVVNVFGPQKGTTPETIKELNAGLENYAGMLKKDLGLDVWDMAGGGASGGLGTGLYALLGAQLHPWADIVMQYMEFDKALQEADIVFTAEGAIDYQTLNGKIPIEVARRAKKLGLPVIALAGTIGEDAHLTFQHGIDSIVGILEKPCLLSEAIENTEELLVNAAERAMQLLVVGCRLKIDR